MNQHMLLSALLAMFVLTACGGGDEGQRANVGVLPEALLTPPCPACQPATVQGVVAAGAPFADAEVTVIDRNGVQRSTRTDSLGHYWLAVQELDAPFVIRSSGLLHGQTRTLHTVVLATEVGRALSNITPLTELLTAQVLQGVPHDVLQDRQADFRRINTRAVRSAQAELERLVRPVLDAAGVPALADLRGSPFQADHTGMDLALDWLVLSQEQGAYRLRHVFSPPSQALVLDPTGTSSTEPLPAPPSNALPSALQGITDQINARLEALTALHANRVPGHAELAALLTTDFLSDGLNASAYLSQVWRRRDAASAGSFSLENARWFGASLLQVQDKDHVLVAFRVAPRAPFAAYTETSWMQKSGGQWQWRGNGKLASVGVRHAAVLGPNPLGDSTEVTHHLVFDIDRRRIDPRVVQVVVRGPGLPEAGLSLAPPTEDDEGIGWWTWAGRRSDDWPAVPLGWCPEQGDARLACQESWSDVRTGSSYQFTLLDAGHQTLQTLTASLPPKPDHTAVLKEQASRWFARFVASPQDTSWLPTLDHLAAASPNPYRGDAPLSARWQAPTAASQSVEAVFDLHAEIPPTASVDASFVVQRVKPVLGQAHPGAFAQASGSWAPLAAGARPRWAVLRLVSRDPAGNLFIHAIAPSHPQ